MAQRHASPHTIGSYRDTFRLLLKFAETRLKKPPAKLAWTDIDAPLIADFLDDLQQQQRNLSARSRNTRLTAIRSLFRYAAFELPAQSVQIQRVLAIPAKRYVRTQVGFLTPAEADALLAAPNRRTWAGCRDHAWLLLALQTGLRLSELTGLTYHDLHLGTGAYVHVLGKGRKERCLPLTKQAVSVLQAWLKHPPRGDSSVLFPNRRGQRMGSTGLQYLLSKHVATASLVCPSLNDKRISPHKLRHTLAMDMLHAGAETTVIALWLGHESIETTHIYLEADLEMKQKVLATIPTPDTAPGLYRPDDQLLAFLNNL
jgi:integrase/recombinase XerD